MIEGERIEYATRTAEAFGGCRHGASGTRAVAHGVGLLSLLSILPAWAFTATAASPADTVIVTAPEDGGSPRTAANLTRTATNRYRLTMERIEKKRDGQMLGQFLVEATNAASSPQTVTLDLAGMQSAYCYYRTPSGQWRRVAVGAGGTSLGLSIQPGVTRISTIPNYTYGEYLAYVDSLRDNRVTKEVAFTDEGGKYKVYRIRVTNPGGVKNKMKICFGKAMHAQEPAGFFMTQGIIDWLLSGDPAANLDNIAWTFYPCPDPKAAHDHLLYNELEKEPYDTGRPGGATYEDDIAAGRHHLIQIEHMWNNEGHNLELESYEYWDPKSGSTDIRDLSRPGARLEALLRLAGLLAALVRMGDRHVLAPQRTTLAAAGRRGIDAQRSLFLRERQRRRPGGQRETPRQAVGPRRQPGVLALPAGDALLDRRVSLR